MSSLSTQHCLFLVDTLCIMTVVLQRHWRNWPALSVGTPTCCWRLAVALWCATQTRSWIQRAFWRTTTSQADMHNIYTILRCSWKVSRNFNNKLEPTLFKPTCLLINKASVVSAKNAPNINSIWHHFRRPLQWILQNRLTEMSNSLQNKKCSVFFYRKFSTTHAHRFRYVHTYYVHASF